MYKCCTICPSQLWQRLDVICDIFSVCLQSLPAFNPMIWTTYLPPPCIQSMPPRRGRAATCFAATRGYLSGPTRALFSARPLSFWPPRLCFWDSCMLHIIDRFVMLLYADYTASASWLGSNMFCCDRRISLGPDSGFSALPPRLCFLDSCVLCIEKIDLVCFYVLITLPPCRG